MPRPSYDRPIEAVALSQRLLACARSGDPEQIAEHVSALDSIDPAGIDGSARIAFWLNVYNARLLHALHDRPRSGHLFRHRRLFSTASYEIGGLEYTLDAIEHGLLRGNRRAPFALRRSLPDGDPRLGAAPAHPDPRIHFALNCGAVSCPPIRAYSAEGLEGELEAATAAYLAAESELDEEGARLRLPGILRLYRGDFDDAGGAVAFARRYLPPAAQADGLKVSYSAFDWTLEGTRATT